MDAAAARGCVIVCVEGGGWIERLEVCDSDDFVCCSSLRICLTLHGRTLGELSRERTLMDVSRESLKPTRYYEKKDRQ